MKRKLWSKREILSGELAAMPVPPVCTFSIFQLIPGRELDKTHNTFIPILIILHFLRDGFSLSAILYYSTLIYSKNSH